MRSKPKRKLPVPHGPHLAQGQLCSRQSDRHAFDRVGVNSTAARSQGRWASRKTCPRRMRNRSVLRGSPQRGELILRGLVSENGVCLQKPSHRHAGLAYSQVTRRNRPSGRFRWRRCLRGQGGLSRPDQEEPTQSCWTNARLHGVECDLPGSAPQRCRYC